MMSQLWLVYGLLNAIVFFIYGVDKLKAIRNSYRVPEKVLLILSAIGPFGGILGMIGFRHKIRKIKFTFLVPFELVIHLALFYYLIFVL